MNSSLTGENNTISKSPSTIDTTSTAGLAAAATALAVQRQVRRNSHGSPAALPQTAVIQGGGVRRSSLEAIRSIEFARRMSLEGATKAAVAAKKNNAIIMNPEETSPQQPDNLIENNAFSRSSYNQIANSVKQDQQRSAKRRFLDRGSIELFEQTSTNPLAQQIACVKNELEALVSSDSEGNNEA